MMRAQLAMTLLAASALLLGACGEGPAGTYSPDAGPDADSDSDTDTDADTDTDIDTDIDTDTDTDGGVAPAIALVQYDADSHFGEYDVNLANLTALAIEALGDGAAIIVLPEMSLYGYATDGDAWCAPGVTSYDGRACHDVSAVAEAVPGGPSTTTWAAFAADRGVYVVYSVPEVDGAAYYNTLGVVGPDGYVTKYRKRALYYIDQAYATAGADDVVLATPWGDFGLMVCMDGTYDGGYYDGYAALGVDAIILSMDWDQDPLGATAAATWFVDRADNNDIVIYAADVSTWDGTGKYVPGEPARERNGLPDPAVGVDGISFHPLE